jgi:hypothetical protein
VTAKARILLLCDDRRGNANTILDHIDAFSRFSRHEVRTFNPKALNRSIALDLDEFDVVVIHYSVVLNDDHYVAAPLRDKLRRFRGLKMQFIQDDYRWVDRSTAASRDIGIQVLFTVVPEPAAGQVYDARLPNVRRVQTLTGYVPENLRERAVRPIAERPIDVGYRARDLPFWLGRLSREKAWIGQRFLELAPPYGLRCDIAWQEHDRIYGEQWIDFVASCRATLGCESGASIADFDGSIEQSVRAYLRAHPAAPYEVVHEALLKPYEGNVIMNVISPRVFEAASLGTALVLFPGEYSGVVSAGEHYIALEKDFSNMDEVVALLRDDSYLSALTARTRNELIKSGRWSFESFVKEFDAVVDEEAHTMRGHGVAPRWRLARAERSLRVPGIRVRLLRAGHSVWNRVAQHDPSMRFAIEYESQIQKGFFTLRTLMADREIRPLLRLGRRSGAPLDRLLREILELSLLRKAAEGGMLPDQTFTLSAEFDPARKAACFVSTPIGNGRVQDDRESQRIREAMRKGELKVIEWDHRALGGRIRLDRPTMEVGIGFEGLENFTVLARIGVQNPAALERALAPALAPTEPVLSAVE